MWWLNLKIATLAVALWNDQNDVNAVLTLIIFDSVPHSIFWNSSRALDITPKQMMNVITLLLCMLLNIGIDWHN